MAVISFFTFLCRLTYISNSGDGIERLEASKAELQNEIAEEVSS